MIKRAILLATEAFPAAALGELAGGRFMLALGVSNAEFNARRGHAWEPPRRKLEAYLDAMDHAAIRSPEPPDLGPRYLAAHGPALQSLAATRADGVVTYLMPVGHAQVSRARIGPAPVAS